MADNRTIKERLVELETLMNRLLGNDIPHIQKDIVAVKSRMSWLMATIIVALMGIIANLII